MELPFEKKVCRYWKQKLYTLVNQEETQEIRLPESMPDVGRVICSWGQAVIRSKDWRSGGIGVSGGVMVWVLYAPEGGGDLQHIESWIPFQSRAEFPDDGEDGTIRVECLLKSVDARSISSRKLMLRTGIGMLVQILVPESAQISNPGELPPDLEVLNRTYPLVLTRETGEKTFLLDEELSLPRGSRPVKQLIYYRMEPELLDQKVMGSKAVFRGIGKLHVLYLDDEGELNSADLELPFAQYMDLDGDYEPDAMVSNLLCLTSLELDMLPEGTLHLKCGMVSQYIINAESVINVLEDIYSPCRSVEAERQELILPAWLEERQQSVDVSQSLPMEDGTLVDQHFMPIPPVVTRQPGGVSIETGGNFQTLLKDQNGEYIGKNLNSRERTELKTECDTICFARPKGSVECRRDAGNWRVETQILLSIGSLCTHPIEMVTSVQAGEAGTPDPERPSVIIRSLGEYPGLWDLAKNNGSTVSAIRKLNKLEGEPEKNRLLLIPVI